MPTQPHPPLLPFLSLLEGRKGGGLGWNEGGGTAPVGASPTDREWPARDADVPRRHWTEGAIERLAIRPLSRINAAMNIGFPPLHKRHRENQLKASYVPV